MAELLKLLDELINWLPAGKDVFDFYAKNLRGGLFSGFLTLSGFLFSVNTFIIVNMKKELYDQEGYLARFEKQLAFDPKRKYYGPLQRLSKLLLEAVISALAASVVQFTIGLIPRWYTAIVCIVVAAVAIFFLARVLWVIRRNLQDLFEFLEQDATLKLKKRQASAAPKTAA